MLGHDGARARYSTANVGLARWTGQCWQWYEVPLIVDDAAMVVLRAGAALIRVDD